MRSITTKLRKTIKPSVTDCRRSKLDTKWGTPYSFHLACFFAQVERLDILRCIGGNGVFTEIYGIRLCKALENYCITNGSTTHYAVWHQTTHFYRSTADAQFAEGLHFIIAVADFSNDWLRRVSAHAWLRYALRNHFQIFTHFHKCCLAIIMRRSI